MLWGGGGGGGRCRSDRASAADCVTVSLLDGFGSEGDNCGSEEQNGWRSV